MAVRTTLYSKSFGHLPEDAQILPWVRDGGGEGCSRDGTIVGRLRTTEILQCHFSPASTSSATITAAALVGSTTPLGLLLHVFPHLQQCLQRRLVRLHRLPVDGRAVVVLPLESDCGGLFARAALADRAGGRLHRGSGLCLTGVDAQHVPRSTIHLSDKVNR